VFALTFLLFVSGYGLASVAYYEKWYSTQLKSELVPYDLTAETVRALVPAGRKDVYASPHFWIPFHDDAATRFISYARPPQQVLDDRPIYLLVDESQWLADLISADRSARFRSDWVNFIESHCTLQAEALGTAYGTIASFECGKQLIRQPLRVIGGGTTYRVEEPPNRLSASDLNAWARYEDPRRTGFNQPDVSMDATGRLRIAGTGWPGIITEYAVTPGQAFLIRIIAAGAREGDLLYLGTWKRPEVLSLSHAASAGMATPLAHEPWFPGDRGFIATASRVQIAIYSEAPRTDFSVSSIEIDRLEPVSPASR
jgi:hypothetical protein